jgi:twitching motility two-component system response regulator PilG
MGLQLAKLLVGEGLVSVDQVREAVEGQRDSGRGLGDSLVTLGYITETDFLGFLGKYYGMPVMDLDSRSIEPEVLKLIPQGTAAEECLIAVSLVGADLIVAVSDPSNILLMDDLGFITGKHIVPVIASERAISAKIAEYYGERSSSRESDNPGRLPRAGKLRSIDEIMRGLEEYTNDKREFTSGVTAESFVETTAREAGEALPGSAEIIDEENAPVIDNAVFDLTDAESGEGGSWGSRSIEIEFPGGDAVSGFTPVIEQSETLEIESRTEESIDGVGETNTDQFSPFHSSDNSAIHTDIDKPAEAESPVTIPGEHNTPQAETEDSSGENGLYTVQEVGEESADNTSSSIEKAKNGAGVKLPKGSILIVDHSPTVRRVVALALEREGYKVYAAGDGMQALAALKDITPGLILVDINLPHMDGYQLCKVIKGHGLTKDIPVVMLSGKVGMMDKVKGRMAGASDYITKPFAAGDIIGAAEKYVI